MIKYPNGKVVLTKQHSPEKKQRSSASKQGIDFAKRGMSLEQELNLANQYYLARGLAVIHKKPTPINIVHVHYPKRSAAVIKEAYFQTPSTTDYNGVYQGAYLDFEAKETRLKTAFPLTNFHNHQIQHMEHVITQAGICFVIVRFTSLERTFVLDAKVVIDFWQNQKKDGRKSIPLNCFETQGFEVKASGYPTLDYLPTIHKIYFS
ncbi:MAG: Holliday junction resolvase RecU [Culicoidibacterales bacterium]